jgi:hypothetical protein
MRPSEQKSSKNNRNNHKKRKTFHDSKIFYISDGGCRGSGGVQPACARVQDG